MPLEYPDGNFPQPEWIVRNSASFGSAPDLASLPVAGQLHLQLNERGHIAGNYNFVVGGSGSITCNILAKRVLNCGVAHNYQLTIHRRVADITFPTNTLSTDWWDLEER